MAEASIELIGNLLSEIEQLYFDHFDEVSDRRKVTKSRDLKKVLIGKIENFVASQPKFSSIEKVGLFLQ